MMNARDKIKEVLEKEFKNSEFFLVDVKQSATKYQVFIDSDDKLSIGKCASISRMLEAILEEENLVPEQYTLEVSSPGMTNPLKHIRQYKKRLGRELDIWMEDNTHYRGELLEVHEESIKIKKTTKKKKKIISVEEINLSLSDVKKAMLIFSFK